MLLADDFDSPTCVLLADDFDSPTCVLLADDFDSPTCVLLADDFDSPTCVLLADDFDSPTCVLLLSLSSVLMVYDAFMHTKTTAEGTGVGLDPVKHVKPPLIYY